MEEEKKETILLKMNMENYKGIKKLNNFTLPFNEKIVANIFYAPNGIGKTTICKGLSTSSTNGTPHDFFNNCISIKTNDFKIGQKKFKQSNIHYMEPFDLIKEKEKYGSNIFFETQEEEKEYLLLKKEINNFFKNNFYLKSLEEHRGIPKEEIYDLYIEKSSKIELKSEDFNVFFSLYENVINKKINLNDFKDLIFFVEEYIKIKSKSKIQSTKTDRDEINNKKQILKRTFPPELYIKMVEELDFQSKKEDSEIITLIKEFKKNSLIQDKEIQKIIDSNLQLFINKKDNLKNVDLFFNMIDSFCLKKNEEIIKDLNKSIEKKDDIVEKFGQNISEWEDIRDRYSSIFPNMPISFKLNKVDLKNAKKKHFKVEHYFKNDFEGNQNIHVKQQQQIKKLYNELSCFEQKGLFLFDLFFKVESIIKKEKDSIFIFDDIIDSFDDINRLSFAYYLKDLEIRGIKFILFTHDFNFFKILKNKLYKKKIGILTKNRKQEVCIINKNLDLDYIFKNWLDKKNVVNDPKSLISSIPLCRELLEILPEKKELINNEKELGDEEKKNLFPKKDDFLPFLHYKKETDSKKISDIFELVKFTIEEKEQLKEKIKENNELYYSLIKTVSNSIINNPNEQDINEGLKSKICLSINIRILLEEKIVKFLGSENSLDLFNSLKEEDKCCQTKFLLRKLQKENKKLYKEVLKFDIATSNIIHLNSLNYEALFCYNLDFLIKLQKELNNKEFKQ